MLPVPTSMLNIISSLDSYLTYMEYKVIVLSQFTTSLKRIKIATTASDIECHARNNIIVGPVIQCHHCCPSPKNTTRSLSLHIKERHASLSF